MEFGDYKISVNVWFVWNGYSWTPLGSTHLINKDSSLGFFMKLVDIECVKLRKNTISMKNLC